MTFEINAMIVSIGAVIIIYILGLRLAIKNLKRDRSHEIEKRRLQKVEINGKRRRMYGLIKNQ